MTPTPNEILRSTKILLFALIGGLVAFSIIIVALSFAMEANPDIKVNENIFYIVLGIVAVGCYSSGSLIYNRRITAIKNSTGSLVDKLNDYRAALVLFFATCEGPGLFGIIIMFLTMNKILLIVPAISIVLMLSKTPTPERTIKELELDWKEQEELKS